VAKHDAALIRGVAQALADPAREAEARSILRARFTTPEPSGFKALLAAAPLEEVELSRESDFDRKGEL
jgi:plasmid stability protein